jgi:hypothetical protein
MKASLSGDVPTKKYHGIIAYHKGCFGNPKLAHYSDKEMDVMRKAKEAYRKGRKARR